MRQTAQTWPTILEAPILPAMEGGHAAGSTVKSPQGLADGLRISEKLRVMLVATTPSFVTWLLCPADMAALHPSNWSKRVLYIHIAVYVDLRGLGLTSFDSRKPGMR